jgi:hypothetical protein
MVELSLRLSETVLAVASTNVLMGSNNERA